MAALNNDYSLAPLKQAQIMPKNGVKGKTYGKKNYFRSLHILTVIFVALLQHVTVVVGEPIDFKDTVKEMKERDASQVDIREHILGLGLCLDLTVVINHPVGVGGFKSHLIAGAAEIQLCLLRWRSFMKRSFKIAVISRPVSQGGENAFRIL